MDFLKTLQLHGLKELIEAKNKDEVRGMIEAEIDLEGVLITYDKFDALVAYMEEKFIQDAETVLFARLRQTKDPIDETRIIAQLNHTKTLQPQFMDYVRAKT